MRMAKLIANERISYTVIPQSLPKIKFQHKLVEFGSAAAIESGISKNQYSIYILFCIGYCPGVIEIFYSE